MRISEGEVERLWKELWKVGMLVTQFREFRPPLFSVTVWILN
jgi:hypothetical protein